jgi:hypothetical protein
VERVAIGAVLGAFGLLACSGGALDIGDDAGDAPDPLDVASDAEVFSAAAVAAAQEACGALPPDLRWTTYTQAELRSDLAGGWLFCHDIAPPEDIRSFQFTADGHWYTLASDGDGGLRRETTGDAGGRIGYEGTYTFDNASGMPSGTDGPAVYLVTSGVPWFHPEFTGRLLQMNWLVDGAQVTCVRIDP